MNDVHLHLDGSRTAPGSRAISGVFFYRVGPSRGRERSEARTERSGAEWSSQHHTKMATPYVTDESGEAHACARALFTEYFF